MAPLFIFLGASAKTAAALATITKVAAVTTAGLGVLQQGRAAEAEAQSAQNIANYNAAVQEREAKALRAKAGFEQRRQAKRGERVKGSLIAALGAAGGLGSPVVADLAAEQAAELELENILIGYEGEIGAERALSQAQLDRLQGKIYKQRGKTLKQASYFGAGTTLLKGFGEAFE